MRNHDRHETALLAAVLLIVSSCAHGCAGSDDSPPTSPTPVMNTGQICRTYATAATTYYEAGGSLVSTATSTCSYDRESNQLQCTGNFTDANDCVAPVATTTQYNSLAEFIDEASVLPPAIRWTQRSGTIGGSCNGQPRIFGVGHFESGTVTLERDGQGRITSVTAPGGETTYTAWDGLGRPTAGPSVALSYDDSSRTVIMTPSMGAANPVTWTFDPFGNLAVTQERPANGPVATATSYLDAAARVCR